MFDSLECLTVFRPSLSVLSHTLLGSCALMDIRTSQAMHHLKPLWTACSSHLTCRRSDSFLTWLLILGSRHSSYILVCGKCLHGGAEIPLKRFKWVSVHWSLNDLQLMLKLGSKKLSKNKPNLVSKWMENLNGAWDPDFCESWVQEPWRAHPSLQNASASRRPHPCQPMT